MVYSKTCLLAESAVKLPLIPDETVMCRCEDVSMRNIRNALSNGFQMPGAIRRATRIGMRCF